MVRHFANLSERDATARFVSRKIFRALVSYLKPGYAIKETYQNSCVKFHTRYLIKADYQ